MKFENTSVMNFEGAFRGMRNPKDSWHMSDSWTDESGYHIGEKDMDLAHRLIAAGSEHRKFMRQIFVSVDIKAPLYWWKEMDTYKIGTTSNSCSTMHKLTAYPITLESFETDDYHPELLDFSGFIDMLEVMRQAYLKTKNPLVWKELVRWLPSSWLQKRTYTMTYENLYRIVRQREFHKLSEWHRFIDWVHTLPYAEELIFYEGESPWPQ